MWECLARLLVKGYKTPKDTAQRNEWWGGSNSLSFIVFVSCSYSNKWLQTHSPKQWKFILLCSGRVKLRADLCSLRYIGRSCFFFSQLLGVFGVPWLVAALQPLLSFSQDVFLYISFYVSVLWTVASGFYSLPNPLQRSLPPNQVTYTGSRDQDTVPIFLRLPSCHCFCLATHPLQIVSWDTHCLRWTLHQSRQQPWWILVTPFGNDWHRGEVHGWEISWHEMGLGCEAARETEINMGKLTNLWWKTSIT